MEATGVGLAEAIDAVREELCKAQNGGRGSDVRFAVGDVELEFVVDATSKGGGEASIKVLSVFSVGGKGEQARGAFGQLAGGDAPWRKPRWHRSTARPIV